MKTSYIIAAALLWLGGMFISNTLDQQYLGTDTTTPLFTLLNPSFGSFSNPLTAIGGFFILMWSWVQALWIMFWWDYSFLSGSWEILKYVGWCFSLGIVVSIIMAVRGVGST